MNRSSRRRSKIVLDDELSSGRMRDRARMEVGNHADADNAEAEGGGNGRNSHEGEEP